MHGGIRTNENTHGWIHSRSTANEVTTAATMKAVHTDPLGLHQNLPRRVTAQSARFATMAARRAIARNKEMFMTRPSNVSWRSAARLWARRLLRRVGRSRYTMLGEPTM